MEHGKPEGSRKGSTGRNGESKKGLKGFFQADQLPAPLRKSKPTPQGARKGERRAIRTAGSDSAASFSAELRRRLWNATARYETVRTLL